MKQQYYDYGCAKTITRRREAKEIIEKYEVDSMDEEAYMAIWPTTKPNSPAERFVEEHFKEVRSKTIEEND
jgi:hypothetical protein